MLYVLTTCVASNRPEKGSDPLETAVSYSVSARNLATDLSQWPQTKLLN